MADLPQDVREIRDRTREFIATAVVPAEPPPGGRLADDVRRELQQRARDAGVFAPHVPREFGGLGLPVAHWSPVFQAAGYSPIGPAVLNCMAPDEGNMHMLELIADDAQKERFLRPLAAGAVRSAFAMTEPHPGAGSDAAGLATTATRVEGGWSISGTKRFTSGADGAGFLIVMARTEAAGDAPAGATMFLVPKGTAGVRLGAHIDTVDRAITGGHPWVHLDDCRVPDDAVLGGVGNGFRAAQVRLAPARLTHCMRWLGLARRALDIALDRAARRELFGARLEELGLAQELIASSVIDIETADALITKAADVVESDPRRGATLSSIAKVHCSEAIVRVVDRAVQLCGGDGVSSSLPLYGYLNEVRPFRIYDGSNETHKWTIARRASAARRAEVEAGAPRLDEVGEPA